MVSGLRSLQFSEPCGDESPHSTNSPIGRNDDQGPFSEGFVKEVDRKGVTSVYVGNHFYV